MALSNEVWAALAGTVVAGGFALLGLWLTSRQEVERRTADEKRRDVEWRREKCNEAYSQAIYYLFKLHVSAQGAALSDKDVRQHLSEAQRYMSLLQAYHPDESQRKHLSEAAEPLLQHIDSPAELSSSAIITLTLVRDSLVRTWGPSLR
jgi:hypothetical protein